MAGAIVTISLAAIRGRDAGVARPRRAPANQPSPARVFYFWGRVGPLSSYPCC
jgi:hypothetical protein